MNHILYFALSMFWTLTIVGIPLFDQYQDLETQIPYIPLAQLPTPVQPCHNLEKALHHSPLFIKRDDLAGSITLYGGNKARKLEFLLADAVQKGAKKIITYGSTGTNHGLATACYAHTLGLECLLMLKHQPNSPVVRQNLLLDHYFGAKIKIFANNAERDSAAQAILQSSDNTYFFPTGGSVPLGAMGFVNAAFELKQQIEEGLLPKPDYIYLPIGSCGTTAGLLLGLTMAHIDSKIVAVAIEPEDAPDDLLEKTKNLFSETNQLIHNLSDNIPLYEFPESQITINKRFCDTQYGVWTPETDAGSALMLQQEGIALEGTYSAKILVALREDIEREIRNPSDCILLWNTYCGLDFSHLTHTVNYKDLPEELHTYFESEINVEYGVSQTFNLVSAPSGEIEFTDCKRGEYNNTSPHTPFLQNAPDINP